MASWWVLRREARPTEATQPVTPATPSATPESRLETTAAEPERSGVSGSQAQVPPSPSPESPPLSEKAKYRVGELDKIRDKFIVLMEGKDIDAQLSKATLLNGMSIAAILDARGEGVTPPQGVTEFLRKTGPREEFMSCDGRYYYFATDEFPEYESLYLFQKDYQEWLVKRGKEFEKGLQQSAPPELPGSLVESVLKRTEQAKIAVARMP